ncbi:MAG: cysteine peptidase family C39 domain-containing protein, partial [bacterium]
MKRLGLIVILIFLLFSYGEKIGASSFTLVSVPYYSIEGYPLASCVLMVLEYYGVKVDQKELKERISAPGGEDPLALLEYIKSKGLKAYIVQLQLKELKNLIEYGEIPIIVGQSFRIPYDYLYWRVVIGVNERGIVTNDPIIRNNYVLDEKRFSNLWVRETNNMAIVILPRDKNLSITENAVVKEIVTSYTNAKKAISKSDWKAAKTELEAFLKQSPDNPLGLNAYAYVLSQVGDIENAKKTIEKAITKAPLYYIYDTAGLIY